MKNLIEQGARERGMLTEFTMDLDRIFDCIDEASSLPDAAQKLVDYCAEVVEGIGGEKTNSIGMRYVLLEYQTELNKKFATLFESAHNVLTEYYRNKG